MDRFFRPFICAAVVVALHGLTASELVRPLPKKEPPLPKEEPPPPSCEFRCPIEIDLTLALDDFRGIYSGSWSDAFGALTALHLTWPYCESQSIQLAGSYGIYDWAGRSSTPYMNSTAPEQQGFITFAATKETTCPSGWNAGIAYDWVLNKNFGLFAVNPNFDQIRAQVGYLCRSVNEWGVWATYGIRTACLNSQGLSLRFKAINQLNLFWCHYFKSDGYAMLWAGTPLGKSLMYKSGRAGIFIFGTQFSVPVTPCLSIVGHGSYMVPIGGSGITPSKNYGSNLSFGITYSFGNQRTAHSPYISLANNSNFMADTNQNF